ncbi:glycerol-3-phosphate dehydrogenase/oxidase [Deltaproteobacteria bacterium TL4]
MSLRTTNINKLKGQTFDVLILGGGINGAVSSSALSSKGAKVALIDKRDFAGFTSHHSSNLAWGGIKYMESLEFLLVRKLCLSRNRLMRNYPSTVEEMRFYTTLTQGFRQPRIFVFLGTLLYWFMGNFFTKAPRLLLKKTMQAEEPVIKLDQSVGGVEYSDAYLHDNDARFVFNFIRTALNHGCIAANYVSSQAASFDGALWHIKAKDEMSGEEFTIKAKVLINACGPFVDEHNQRSGQTTTHRHVFSKGIHLLVKRLSPHKRILTFFADDGRLFFVIPMGPRTCLGTTDTKVDSPYTEVTNEDRQFVLDNINKRLNLEKPLTFKDIVAERCGVRPLVISGQGGGPVDWVQLSRKHAVEVNEKQKHLSIFGGKLTDCLNVGDEICHQIKKLGIELSFSNKKWYGESPKYVRDEFFHQAKLMDLDGMTSPSSSEPLSIRLWRRYGDRAFGLLESIRCDPKMAEVLIKNAEYIRCEIEQTARWEMITKLEDFLRRRSKISQVVRTEDLRNAPGLKEVCEMFFGDQAEAKLEEYFHSQSPTTEK